MSVLRDLAERLDTAGVGTYEHGTGNGTIFTGGRPRKPDECITLQTYVGDPSRIFDDNYRPSDERRNVQAMTRAATGGAAQTLADVAWKAIQGRHVTLNGRYYAHIRAPVAPAFVGYDENRRPLVAFNIEIRRDGDLTQ